MVFHHNPKKRRIACTVLYTSTTTDEIFLLRFFKAELTAYMKTHNLTKLVFPTFVYDYDKFDNSIQWYPTTSEKANFHHHLRKLPITPKTWFKVTNFYRHNIYKG